MAKLYKDVGNMDSFRTFMDKAKELQTEQLALTKKGADDSDNKDEKEMVSSLYQEGEVPHVSVPDNFDSLPAINRAAEMTMIDTNNDFISTPLEEV